MKKIFEKIENKVAELLKLEASGHDLYHAKRTFNVALEIAKIDGGDELIIGATALLHDVLRPWEKKNKKPHYKGEALEIIKDILKSVTFPEDKIDEVLNCIEVHETYKFTKGKKAETIEAKIVQDADRLDALGAIGIARTFMFTGHRNKPLWIPGEEAKDFNPDIISNSAIIHFKEKLLKLKDTMNTKTGKKLAEKRHDFMELYLNHFFKEWEGEL